MVPSEDNYTTLSRLGKVLLAEMPFGAAFTDMNLQIIEANAVFARSIGGTEEGLVGVNVLDFVLPSYKEKVVAELSHLGIKGNNRAVLDLGFENRKGRSFNAMVNFVRVEEEGQAQIFIRFQNLKWGETTHDALRQNRIQDIFEHSPFGIVIRDIGSGKIVDANMKYREITGYTLEELIEKTTLDITAYEEMTQRLAMESKMIKGEISSYATIKQYRHKKGEKVWVKVSRSVIELDNYLYVIGYVEDLTQLKQIEIARKESALLTKQLAETIPDHIAIVDLESLRMVYNNFNFNYFGHYLEPGINIREFFHRIIHPEDKNKALVLFLEKLKEAKEQDVLELDFRILSPEGNFRMINERVKLIKRLDSGQPKQAMFVHRDVTHQHETEIALKKSESLYRGLFENNTAGILVTNKNLRIVNVNEAFCTITGYKESELKNRPVTEFMDPEFRKRNTEVRQQMISNKAFQYTLEGRFFRKDKTDFHAFITVKRLNDLEDRFSGIQASIIDITRLKTTQHELRSRNRFIEKVNETIPDILYIFDIPNKKVTYSNKSIGQFLGYGQGEYPGLVEVLHPDDTAKLPERLKNLNEASEELIIEIEFRLKARNGNFRWFNCRQKVYQRSAKTGEIVQYIALAQDITPRKESELALKESESRFRGIVETLAEYITISDRNGKLEYVSNPVQNILGFSPSELIGTNMKAYLPRAEWVKVVRGFKDEYAGPFDNFFPHTLELQIPTKEGDMKWIESTTAPFLKSRTREFQYITISRDITLKKKINDAIRFIYEIYAGDDHTDFLQSMLRNIYEVAEVSHVMLATWSGKEDTLFVHEAILRGKMADNFEAFVKGTPCLDVMKRGEMIRLTNDIYDVYPKVAKSFGTDLKGYVGIPLINSKKEVSGVLCTYYTKDIIGQSMLQNLLQIYATRISSEMERHINQKALIESEALFRSLFDDSPLAVGLITPAGDIVKVNALFCDLLGYSENKLTGMAFRQVIFEEDWHHLKDHQTHLVENSSAPHYVEIRFQREDSNTFWAGVSTSVIYNEEGTPRFFLRMINDITERKLAESEKQRLYYEQQILIDSIPAIFYFKDKNGVIKKSNKAAASAIEKSVSEVEGKQVEGLIPDYAKPIFEGDHDIFQTGQSILGETKAFETPKGKFWLRIDKTPFYNQDGTVNGVIVYAIDVTNLIEVQQALKDKNQELQEYIDSNMLLENFAYIASHDLKEPVRTVCNFTQLLEKKYLNLFDERGKEYLKFIISGAKQMDGLIEDLLTYSRVRSHKESIENVRTEVVLFIVQRNLSVSIAKSRAQIIVEELPEFIMVNRTKIIQLMQNLISNAIKFAKPKVPPIVRIRGEADGAFYKFSVSDNGIGINIKHFDRIFLLFKKLHTKEEYEGSGIGLAICKKIVEQHNGKIWVDSHPEEGTTFYFTLPKEQEGKV